MLTFEEMEVLLQFKLKLVSGDPSITTEINYLNTQNLSENVAPLLNESLREYFSELDRSKADFFVDAISKLNVVDSKFFIHMLDVEKLSSDSLTREQKEIIVAEKLSLPNDEIRDNINRNILYYAIVVYAIKSDNPTLIKKAIDKIQSFNQ